MKARTGTDGSTARHCCIFPAEQDRCCSLKPLKHRLARVNQLPYFCRPPDLATGVRAATAPLPQARSTSAQEGPALPKPEQAMENPFSLPSPAATPAQKPSSRPAQEDFRSSALFQPSHALAALAEDMKCRFAKAPFRAMFPARQGCAPLPWAQPEGAAASQAARSSSPPQPRGAPALEVQRGSPAPELSQLPPRGPRPARRSTSQLNLETAVSPAHHKNSVPSEVEMHSCLPASSVLSWL